MYVFEMSVSNGEQSELERWKAGKRQQGEKRRGMPGGGDFGLLSCTAFMGYLQQAPLPGLFPPSARHRLPDLGPEMGPCGAMAETQRFSDFQQPELGVGAHCGKGVCSNQEGSCEGPQSGGA